MLIQMVQFASCLRRVLCKTRLIFPRINGPIVPVDHGKSETLTEWTWQVPALSSISAEVILQLFVF